MFRFDTSGKKRDKLITIRVNSRMIEESYRIFFDKQNSFTQRYCKISTADLIDYLLANFLKDNVSCR